MDKVNELMAYAAQFKFVEGVTPLSHIYWPIGGSILYVIMITVLPMWMKNREPFKFKFLLSAHNIFLSVLSFFMCLGVMYNILPYYFKGGWTELICDPLNHMSRGTHVFWYYIFYLSKYYEFFDTMFQILKKRKLIFLHTYHHVITLWLIWVTMSTNFSIQWGDIAANAFVHIIMYYYYYLTERGEKPWWKKYITKVQIVQFIFDMTTHFLWYWYNATTPGGCNGFVWVFHFANFVIGSFLVLFLQFYFTSYRRPAPKSAGKAE
jgi:fatty acid elongase 3